MNNRFKKTISLLICALLLATNSLFALQSSAVIRVTCRVLPQPANLSIAQADVASFSGKSIGALESFAANRGLALYAVEKGSDLLVKFTKTA